MVVLSFEVGHGLTGRRSGSLVGLMTGGRLERGAGQIAPQWARRVSISDMSGWTGKAVRSLHQVACELVPRGALQGYH